MFEFFACWALLYWFISCLKESRWLELICPVALAGLLAAAYI